MPEYKEATTSRKSAHKKKKKATNHHVNTLASHIWKRCENFEIFGIISCNPKWANFRGEWQDSDLKQWDTLNSTPPLSTPSPCVFHAFALMLTFREHIIVENLTAWPFEPICYTPHPLIRTGLEGPLPQGCNAPAAQPQSWILQTACNAKHMCKNTINVPDFLLVCTGAAVVR